MYTKLKRKVVTCIQYVLHRIFRVVLSPLNTVLGEREKYLLWEIWKGSFLHRLPDTRLEHFECSVFSQNGEDGIIAEIFRRIGTDTKTFIEIGVEVGKQCNTRLLLMDDWKGLWIEGNEEYCAKIYDNCREYIDNKQLTVKNAFVTRTNIDLLIADYMRGDIDLLSIDIDGNDYYVLSEIQAVTPRVIITEYNANFPPPYRFVIAYDDKFIWKGDDYYGASLSAFYDLLVVRGNYELVGCDFTGTNAFWVRRDLTGELFPYEKTAEKLFNRAKYSFSLTGHPASFRNFLNLNGRH